MDRRRTERKADPEDDIQRNCHFLRKSRSMNMSLHRGLYFGASHISLKKAKRSIFNATKIKSLAYQYNKGGAYGHTELFGFCNRTSV